MKGKTDMRETAAQAYMIELGVTIPDRWVAERVMPDALEQLLLIAPPGPGAPGGGYVTVDFRGRGYRLGFVIAGRFAGTKVYKGTAWRQRLVDDAVACLRRGMR